MRGTMNTEGSSPFILQDEFVAHFRAGRTIEVECTQTITKFPTGYRGRWILRCVTQDGHVKTLATARRPTEPRELKTLDGLGGFVLYELNAAVAPMVVRKGMVARFNSDGLLP